MLHPGRAARWFGVAVVVALLLVVTMQAQRRQFGWRWNLPSPGGVEYDGRFTLVRLWYAHHPGWSYDYPDMERNLARILDDLTHVHVRHDASSILRMDDPELMKFPLAYLSEPGYWYPTDSEAQGLRAYLAKGGFLIVDDFHFEDEWRVFEAAMRKVLPAARIERLAQTHPVFHSFFSIASLDVPYPGRLGQNGLMGEFYGIHEDNDPSNRLMVVINYNMDIGDYMEHSARGFYAIDPTNEAFKFGVNYVIYGLTH
ncbi:MAG TPA: DUF4159 domain-containing protein [Vicinamibacterales bacterium]|nr:DUF4159 domain-containing protein [Vicinamibacterales bacterium]